LAITDGADDKQIDAIVIDDDAQSIAVVQGKFIGASGPVDAANLREVLASWVQLKDLAQLQQNANLKLKQRLTDLAQALEDDYDIHFGVDYNRRTHGICRKGLGGFQKELADSDDFPAMLTLVNTDELTRRYELALLKEIPLSSTIWCCRTAST
jgi:hypothetical protein